MVAYCLKSEEGERGERVGKGGGVVGRGEVMSRFLVHWLMLADRIGSIIRLRKEELWENLVRLRMVGMIIKRNRTGNAFATPQTVLGIEDMGALT
ncbi:hypothetical protein Tco_0009048 [Tanacetum coccineum]